MFLDWWTKPTIHTKYNTWCIHCSYLANVNHFFFICKLFIDSEVTKVAPTRVQRAGRRHLSMRWLTTSLMWLIEFLSLLTERFFMHNSVFPHFNWRFMIKLTVIEHGFDTDYENKRYQQKLILQGGVIYFLPIRCNKKITCSRKQVCGIYYMTLRGQYLLMNNANYCQ